MARQRIRWTMAMVVACVVAVIVVTAGAVLVLGRDGHGDDGRGDDGRGDGADGDAVDGRAADGDGTDQGLPPAASGEDVAISEVLGHLRALQQIADDNGGNRASGRSGYQASVDYVVDVLRAAGYAPELRELELPFAVDTSELEQLAPVAVTYASGGAFTGAAFLGGPRGEAIGEVVGVDLAIPPGASGSTSGCEAEDFAGLPPGSIALLQRGTCSFEAKVLNAQAAGAGGAIVMNEGTTDRVGIFTMRGDGSDVTIPVVSATYDVGEDLALADAPRVRINQSVSAGPTTVTSVIAQTPSGDPRDVVMVGAHLDSAPEGPGMNDNGSGSATLLALAEQLSGVELNSAVRFAWWAAEEDGLLGSTDYAENLTPAELDQIAVYLNADMIASPNSTFEIYDGDNSSGAAQVSIPDGSAQIEEAFQRYFTERGLPYEDSSLDGGSDYVGFADAGIPVGGLFTGADGAKSAEQVKKYGGLAGIGYDLCYHEPCDSLADGDEVPRGYGDLGDRVQLVGNINVDTLDVMADACATVVVELAADTSTIDR